MVLEARRAQILAGSGPFREKLINDDRFRGYPAEIAQGSSEEEEEDVSEDVPLGTLQCSEGVSGGPPDGQDYPLPASSDEEEVPASVGGLVLQQIRLLESPIDPQSFSFGDDFLEEDSGVSGKVRSAKSKKRQKGQVIEKLAFRYSSPGSASELDRGAGRSSAGPVAPQNAAQHVGMASGTGTTGGGGGGTAARPQEAGGGVAACKEMAAARPRAAVGGAAKRKETTAARPRAAEGGAVKLQEVATARPRAAEGGVARHKKEDAAAARPQAAGGVRQKARRRPRPALGRPRGAWLKTRPRPAPRRLGGVRQKARRRPRPALGRPRGAVEGVEGRRGARAQPSPRQRQHLAEVMRVSLRGDREGHPLCLGEFLTGTCNSVSWSPSRRVPRQWWLMAGRWICPFGWKGTDWGLSDSKGERLYGPSRQPVRRWPVGMWLVLGGWAMKPVLLVRMW
ncbi:hypothetical protein PRIEUP_LOCUS1642 [Pristimantis euphronides]